nr:hypothetical protein [Halomicroarcula sp. SHR3]
MRRLTILLSGLGTLLVVLGALLGLLATEPATRVPPWIAVVGGLLVFGLALWKLVHSPSGGEFAPPPWSEGGAIVDERPESTQKSDPISGTELSDVIETAASDAREDTVQAGLATVRAPLRETLVAALRRGGWDSDRIDAALADGSWTDDPVAAAVLDENVVPPERSLRRRVWAWLFPGKAVRHRTARAVGAVARAADAALPPVVGQRAPRPMPVVEPTLDDLQRATDGRLRRAVEGGASVGAPEYEKDSPDGASSPDGSDVTPEREAAAGSGPGSTADQGRDGDTQPTDGDSDPVAWPTERSGVTTDGPAGPLARGGRRNRPAGLRRRFRGQRDPAPCRDDSAGLRGLRLGLDGRRAGDTHRHPAGRPARRTAGPPGDCHTLRDQRRRPDGFGPARRRPRSRGPRSDARDTEGRTDARTRRDADPLLSGRGPPRRVRLPAGPPAGPWLRRGGRGDGRPDAGGRHATGLSAGRRRAAAVRRGRHSCGAAHDGLAR